jgi:hypothetical protein
VRRSTELVEHLPPGGPGGDTERAWQRAEDRLRDLAPTR